MSIVAFCNNFISDYNTFRDFKKSESKLTSSLNTLRGVSLLFRGMGVIVLSSSASALLSIACGPHLTVARVALNVFALALGYDLIVTGNNLIQEINVIGGQSNSAKPVFNFFKSLWDNGISSENGFFDQNFDRYLVGTYVFNPVYFEAKAYFGNNK